MKFKARVIPSGNATAVEVPTAVMKALGGQARPPVAVTINGHTWRSRVAAMRGQQLIGISAANREAAGIAEGETIEVGVELDDAPRTVELPDDLAKALKHGAGALAAFEHLPFGLKQKHVRDIEASSTPVVRERRIGMLVATLMGQAH
jgi:antitoxin component of MazEF toxin-antitoxin module